MIASLAPWRPAYKTRLHILGLPGVMNTRESTVVHSQSRARPSVPPSCLAISNPIPEPPPVINATYMRIRRLAWYRFINGIEETGTRGLAFPCSVSSLNGDCCCMLKECTRSATLRARRNNIEAAAEVAQGLCQLK